MIQRVVAPRPVRVGFVIVLAVLLVSNLVNLWLNQRARPFGITPRNVYLAATGRNVHGSYRTYYRLRRLMAGKRLTIPRAMLAPPVDLRRHVWFLARLSRIDVDFTDEHHVLTIPRFRRLRERSDEVVYLRSSAFARHVEVYLDLDRTTQHYVIAQHPDGRSVIVMPMTRLPSPQPPPPPD
jgi:hypothetical protein